MSQYKFQKSERVRVHLKNSEIVTGVFYGYCSDKSMCVVRLDNDERQPAIIVVVPVDNVFPVEKNKLKWLFALLI